MEQSCATNGSDASTPPANTRASGRARAVALFQQRQQPYVINWDSIACDSRDFLVMGDPFKTYTRRSGAFSFAAPRLHADRRKTACTLT